MRVTSDFFVTALIRRIFSENGFAAIGKRGAAEAGAVFIVVDRLDDCFDFYGPAPQAMFMDQPRGRLFELVLGQVTKDKISARLEQELRMDPDHWVIEIEARGGKVDLPLASDDSPPDTPADRFFKF